MLKPARKRALVTYARETYGMGFRAACRLFILNCSTGAYQSHRTDDAPIRLRLNELARSRPRYGYRRLHILLYREVWRINRKKILRLYREESLAVRTKRRRKITSHVRGISALSMVQDERWSADFVSDVCAEGQRFRTLNIIDTFTRECLAISVSVSFPSEKVVSVFEKVVRIYGKP